MLPISAIPPMIETVRGSEGRGGGAGGARSSSSVTRLPLSRSRPHFEQRDMPGGTTPPQVGQRRDFDRASAALTRLAGFLGPSSKSARASATGLAAAGLAFTAGGALDGAFPLLARGRS